MGPLGPNTPNERGKPLLKPHSQESHCNDVATYCPKRQVQYLKFSRCRSSQGERTSPCEVPEGSNFSADKFGEWALPILGTAHRKV